LNGGILAKAPGGKNEAMVLNPNVATRRGYSRALGVAATPLLQATLSDTISVLLRAADIRAQTDDEQDAESRVAAIQALVDICSRTGGGVDPLVLDDETLVESVVRTLVNCVQYDYGVDERGDVGSWVRKEAMLGLERLLLNYPFKIRALERRYVGRRVTTPYGPGVISRVVGDADNLNMSAVDGSDGTDTEILCHVVFEKPTLGFYYFPPKGTALIRMRRLHVLQEEAVDSTVFNLPASAERTRTPQ
jgi:hypothetical protein